MGTVSLGKIAFTWRGAYDASATYARQDVVGHNGDSFVCLADATTSVTPHANSPAWDLFAQGTQGVSSLPGVRIAQRRVMDLSSYGSSSEQGLVFLLDDGQVLASGYAGEAQLPEDDSETSYVPYPVIL
jgi:hypothetical protein